MIMRSVLISYCVCWRPSWKQKSFGWVLGFQLDSLEKHLTTLAVVTFTFHIQSVAVNTRYAYRCPVDIQGPSFNQGTGANTVTFHVSQFVGRSLFRTKYYGDAIIHPRCRCHHGADTFIFPILPVCITACFYMYQRQCLLNSRYWSRCKKQHARQSVMLVGFLQKRGCRCHCSGFKVRSSAGT